MIVFTPNTNGGLYRVPASGGSPIPIPTPSEATTNDRWPWFLPDGRHFLYMNRGGLRVASLDSPDNKPLAQDIDNAIFVSGHLLFVRDRTLMAQPFDDARLETVGDAVPIAEQVYGSQGRGFFSASDQGVLIYETGAELGPSQLTWFDRSGKPIGLFGKPAQTPNLHLSPDGKSLVVQHSEELWMYEVARGLGMRFVVDGRGAREAVWSPDGKRVVFNSIRNVRRDLYVKSSDGTGQEEPLVASNNDKYPTSWSPDGRFILYYSLADSETRTDLWVVPVAGDRKPFPFLRTRFEETRGQFSPDGRWIAYSSDESDRYEVYIAAFPGPGGKRRISATGGGFPRWRRDGREIFYFNAEEQLVAVEMSSNGTTLDVGPERVLFDVPIASVTGGYPYDVTADGQRFLVNVRERAARDPLTLVVNWAAALGRPR